MASGIFILSHNAQWSCQTLTSCHTYDVNAAPPASITSQSTEAFDVRHYRSLWVPASCAKQKLHKGLAFQSLQHAVKRAILESEVGKIECPKRRQPLQKQGVRLQNNAACTSGELQHAHDIAPHSSYCGHCCCRTSASAPSALGPHQGCQHDSLQKESCRLTARLALQSTCWSLPWTLPHMIGQKPSRVKRLTDPGILDNIMTSPSVTDHACQCCMARGRKLQQQTDRTMLGRSLPGALHT